MKNKEYITRLFDKTLEFALKSSGAVLVEGPKWCGKSTTCSRQAKEIVDLTPPDGRDQLINEARIAPHEFLSSRGKPLLIDEWQHVYFIWDQIKYEVDNAQEFGQFILTGSVTDKAINDENFLQNRHTGTGRIVRRKMRTMSLYESGDSNGLVSISDLKEGRFSHAKSKATIYDYAFYICRGGWPLAIKQDKDVALAQAVNYYETVVTDDIFSLKSVKLIKDEGKARRVMRSYSRNISIAASDETMIKDCTENNESFDKETFYKYINALEILQVIEELQEWNPNIISKTEIRKSTLKNKWIWLLAVLFVLADKALFVANGMEASKVTIMTLIKQSGCIVTILGGKFVFKEKNVGYKLFCAAIIIAGIVIAVIGK